MPRATEGCHTRKGQQAKAHGFSTVQAKCVDGGISSCKSSGSMMLALASTVLFALCELPGGVSSARSLQLLLAAFLCAVLAALHTHAVLGKSLSGWRLYQPFHGGTEFVLRQAFGWMSCGLMTLGCVFAIASGGALPSQIHGYMCTLGFVQLLGQGALLLSLAHFDSTQAGSWKEKGVPLTVLGVAILYAALAVGSLIYAGGVARQCAGFAILAIMVSAQALGLHYMWTLTWNFMTICCFLIESEAALTVMAAIGVCSICAPWYIGRVLYSRADFCKRAMIGQSAWVCDEVLAHFIGSPPGRFYMHTLGLWPLRLTFWHFDTVLHLLAAWVLLQQYAWSIRPIHVLGSAVVTLGWFSTLFCDHKVWDMEAVRGGRMKLCKWGSSSHWEPLKVAQIYMFENKHIEQDTAYLDAAPGFATIVIVAHVVMAVVAALPNAGDIFFACGLGQFVSMQSLFYVGCYCLFGAGVAIAAGASQLAHKILTAESQDMKDDSTDSTGSTGCDGCANSEEQDSNSEGTSPTEAGQHED